MRIDARIERRFVDFDQEAIKAVEVMIDEAPRDARLTADAVHGEGAYATASKGATDYGLKVIEVSRANSNAAFDFAAKLLTVKSLADAVELSTSHMRKQFDTFSEQGKELSALAQKVTTETVEPIKESVTSAFKKVA